LYPSIFCSIELSFLTEKIFFAKNLKLPADTMSDGPVLAAPMSYNDRVLTHPRPSDVRARVSGANAERREHQVS
jgi:hypothetical protein